MRNVDSFTHTRGESQYIDDIRVPQGTLYAAVFSSPVAHGKIRSLDVRAAAAQTGVVKVFCASDIPGENQIGGVIPDEPLLAAGEVHCIGQPVCFAVAESEEAARAALTKVKIDIEPLPVVTDPREAAAKNMLIMPPMTVSCGDVQTAFEKCDVIVQGRADTGGQEHLYLETQGALAWLAEDGGVSLFSSTQGPTIVQRTVARLLGIPMHKVQVSVQRLGGGFGGKEDQATCWAGMTALAASALKLPVKLVLQRGEDMRMTGKRHPYSSDYKLGLTKEGKILAYEVTFYQNSGCSADLSPPVLSRSLLHANNTYYIPNLKATGYCCKTNLPSNTAFRGFGAPQAMFVIEAALTRAAAKLNIPVARLQEMNLLDDGQAFHYGQKAHAATARRCFRKCREHFSFAKVESSLAEFNSSNARFKKGMSVMPVCFGISFTKTTYNQASSLVHIYRDGSVGVSTAAVEMGQGVNTKIIQVVAQCLSISPSRVRIGTTSTSRNVNTSASAASSEPDLNGKASEAACLELRARLCRHAARMLNLPGKSELTIAGEKVFNGGDETALQWSELVENAYHERVDLSAHAHYATPGIHFDIKAMRGEPFAYHVYGTAFTVVTVDCLRGTYEVDSVKIVHDAGQTMNAEIDRGQVEGALMQGLGWMTLEEVRYNSSGKLLNDTLSTYKVPDVYGAVGEIELEFLADSPNPRGIFGSKAVGEPPFMYGIGTYFALENAIKAFRPGVEIAPLAPMTPERVLLLLFPPQ